MATTPGIRPAIPWLTLVTGTFFNSSPFNELTAPDNVAFFCVPYPTTTTSSSNFVSSCKVILIDLRPSTGISTVLKEINETIKTAFSFDKLSVNFPSKSDCVPLEVPFSRTLAPGRGAPLASKIPPLTWNFCKTSVDFFSFVALFCFRIICLSKTL